METRDLNAAIRELVALLPANAGPVAERACIDNLHLYPQPERSKVRFNDYPHSYGPNGTKICDDKHGELVFAEMLKDGRCSAPTYSQSPIYTGKIETLLPLDDLIVKFVDQQERSVYNITLPKHIFFPGFVKLKVVEKDTTTVVEVSGKGKGNWMVPNVAAGPLLFETILKEYLVPRVNQQLRAIGQLRESREFNFFNRGRGGFF